MIACARKRPIAFLARWDVLQRTATITSVMPSYARVIPDRAGDRALDYLIPGALVSSLAPGSRVRVPLRARLVLATVIEVLDASPVKSPREIHEMIGGAPLIRPRLLEIARWISEYYCCSLETAMACVLPRRLRQAKISPRKRNFARLTRKASEEELAAIARKAPRQADALRAVQESGSPRPVTELAEEAGVSESVFRALERNGWVAIEAEDVAREPFSGETFLPTNDLVLNAEQSLAVEALKKAIETPIRPLLLFGVTGSGKTEIYLQAIRHAMSLGRTALVLVPEISLTPQTVERFKSRFADAQREVAVLHSHLSAGERHDEWHKIHAGAARIVIGARSAVFAPSTGSELSSSMRSTKALTSRKRRLAIMRATLPFCARSGKHAPLSWAAQRPLMESWHNCATRKIPAAQALPAHR